MRFCGNCGQRLPEVTEAALVFDSPTYTTAPQVDPAQLGVMTGSDLLERFRRAGLESRGQRRSVTVLFVDLSGYTSLSERLSDEDLYSMVQQFINVLVNDVYKYEGMVDKLTGDGLMALFGAPIAYENNAERAVRSALDMLKDVQQLSSTLNLPAGELRIHVGLHSGSVIVGGLGGDGLMNYTAIGDSVNLARRLEEAAAPGEVLVSDSVYRQTHRLFTFDHLPPIAMKHISQPVQPYRLVAPKAAPMTMRGIDGLSAPMIGREREFRQVQELVERLIQERIGGLLLLAGEGGMGKSRMIRELKHALVDEPLRVIEGQSLTYRKSIAYWIFQDVLRNALAISNDSAEPQVRRRLEEVLVKLFGEAGREKLPYLEHLLGYAISDPVTAERIRYLDSGQLRQLIFLAVRDFLTALARTRPLLLILEDLHWADEASLELVRFLMDSTRSTPLLILAVSRPVEGGALQALHERASQRLGERYTFLRLQALPPNESEHLLHALLAIADLPASLREQMIERSAGLPLYLEEILRMLIEDHTIQQQDGVWMMAPGADRKNIGVPQTLQGLILARFDRLPSLQRQILQTAAVVGYQFNRRVLGEVLRAQNQHIPLDDVEDALQALIEKEFIDLPPDARSSVTNALEEVPYQFKHVLVCDAVYSTLLQRDRQGLHTQVGQAIERLYEDRIDGQIEVLASHYLRSALLERALHYLILAGQKSARSYINEQALQWFQQALEILQKTTPTAEQVLQVHSGLGEALRTAGEYAAARENFQRGLSTLGVQNLADRSQARPLDPQRARTISQLLCKVSSTYVSQGNYDNALEYLQLAQKLLPVENTAFDSDRASILNETGWIFFHRGEFDQAEAILQDGLRLAEQTGQLDVIASILNRLAGILYQRDAIEQATRYLMRSLRLREEIGDIVAVARVNNNLGLLSWKSGNLQPALEHFQRSYRLQQNLGDVEGLIMVQTNLGLIEMDCGNLAGAQQHFFDALQSAQLIGQHFLVAMAYLHLALFHVYAENWQTALEYGRRAQHGFEELGVTEHALDLMVSFGWAHLGLGQQQELGQVRARIETLLQEELQDEPGEAQARALRLLAEIDLQNGSLHSADAMIENSAQMFLRLGNTLEYHRSRVIHAKILRCQEKQALALPMIHAARDIFERMGARLDLSKTEQIL